MRRGSDYQRRILRGSTSNSADIINTAKQNGGRIFAVGTTVTRCPESAYSREHNCLKASSGWTALYIHPKLSTEVADCLPTNLHQPQKTTHMVLTGQFVGVDSTHEGLRPGEDISSHVSSICLRLHVNSYTG